ncbi:uncharacterized protein LOC108738255 isoform X2 [Agrilus planipennis]|uniref:Uncharacterized protein LOC108738255 isoform X2 n=1 Tax=Agrilus planipennis TaxID=224129 RepID=A0A1W4X2T4_AGRPL|nr:uncharacterized protein LOC108738255 isoform X2 [Agrilus planipennis]
MQKLYGRQTQLLQGNAENMNRISSVAQNKKTSDINVSSAENTTNKHSFINSSSIRGMASEDELLKYIMKVNSPPVKEETSESEKERGLFEKFLKEVRSFKPEPIKYWSGLQHYVYFIYRHFLTTKPLNATEIYPSAFTKKIRELMEFLLREDRTQLFLRLLALLREFAYVGKECYKNSNITKIPANLVSLMAYYSAFCSAADKLSPLVPEIDILLMDRFQVNWLCLNKSIFYHYIYLDPCVQTKLPAFAKLQSENKSFHKKIIDSYECFKEDMTLLAARWNNIRMCISILSKKSALENPAVKLITDYMTYQEDTKILKSNYWIIRTEKQKKIQEPTELDAHILALVGNLGQMSDAIIDKIGHCVCDDCLSDEFTKVIYDLEPDTDQNVRRISCYICRDIIPLETFVNHVVIKHQGCPSFGAKSQDRKIRTARRLAKLGKTREEGEGAEDMVDFEARRVKEEDDKDDISNASFVLDEAGIMQMMHLTLCHQLALDTSSQPSEEYKQPAPGQIVTVEEFDKQAERLFSDFLRKRAGLTQSQVVEVCRKGAERIAKKKAAEKKEKEKEKTSLENKEKPVEEKVVKDKKAAKLETIEKKIAAIAAQRKVAVMAAAAAAEKKAAAKAIEERAAEKKMIEKKLLERKPAEGREKDGNKKDVPKQEVLKNSEKITTENVKKEHNVDAKKEEVPQNPVAKNRNLSTVIKDQADVISATNKKQNVLPTVAKTTCSQTSQCNGIVNKNNYQDGLCNHTCNSKEEVDGANCCGHHKEVLKKCDCPYCEILGTTIPTAPWQKTSETRDRLRTRLHQRKERDHLNANKPVTNGANSPKNTCTHQKASRYQKQSFIDSVTKSLNNIDTALPMPTPSCLNTHPKAVAEQQSVITGSTSSLSSSSLNSLQDNGDSRDINELLNFIEGNKKKDKIALAEKKAAKKARQKKKREDEKKRQDLEAKRKEEERLREERRKEEKIKEEKRKLEKQALELANQKKHMSKSAQKKEMKLGLHTRVEQHNVANSNIKKKDKKVKDRKEIKKQIEESIPAMVTIKRVPENGCATPTVTITLKGSTPDQDRLLYTLVNGQTKDSTAATIKAEKNGKKSKTQIKIKPQHVGNDKKKNESKKSAKENRRAPHQQNELKVTLSIEKNNVPSPSAVEENPKKTQKCKKQPKKKNVANNKSNEKDEKYVKNTKAPFSKTNTNNKSSEGNLDLPILRLPPGITITKIDGPAVNRSFKNVSSTMDTTPKFSSSIGSSASGNKSGVIVVDTEKLIQQSFLVNEKKKLKKKNKKANKNGNVTASISSSNAFPPTSSVSVEGAPGHPKENGPSMVTLKNPIFHSLQSALSNKSDKLELHAFPSNQQASIIKNENGMVTIRSPRLQQFEGGSCLSSILSDLKPVMETSDNTVSTSSSSCWKQHNDDNEKKSPFNAQAILSGLPGIQITKIDKNSIKTDYELRKNNNNQLADVSIIPTGNNKLATNVNKTSVPLSDIVQQDRADWYDNVFTPREVLEEDLDAAERDIEAFKRFCHQTVVPEHKEKVAHLNVQDIVFKKKSDLSFFS